MKEFKYSEERRKRISEGTKRAMADPSIRKKISDAKKGKPSHRKGAKMSDESKKKMSDSSKGQIAWNKGRTDLKSPTKETIEKRKLKMTGKDNPEWKGDRVGYGSLHSWIRRHYGNADRCENKVCTGKSSMFEWANISGKYQRDREDFMMLCRSCHRKFDKGSLSLEIIKG